MLIGYFLSILLFFDDVCGDDSTMAVCTIEILWRSLLCEL